MLECSLSSSCVGNHRCCELMRATFLLYYEDTHLLCYFLPSGYYIFFTSPAMMACALEGGAIDFPFVTECCSNTLCSLIRLVSFVINHCSQIIEVSLMRFESSTNHGYRALNFLEGSLWFFLTENSNRFVTGTCEFLNQILTQSGKWYFLWNRLFVPLVSN